MILKRLIIFDMGKGSTEGGIEVPLDWLKTQADSLMRQSCLEQTRTASVADALVLAERLRRRRLKAKSSTSMSWLEMRKLAKSRNRGSASRP